MFSKQATKFDKIFIVNLTLWSKCQIDGEDFVNFCGLVEKQELYDWSTLISLINVEFGINAKVAKSLNVEVGINVEGVQKLPNH